MKMLVFFNTYYYLSIILVFCLFSLSSYCVMSFVLCICNFYSLIYFFLIVSNNLVRCIPLHSGNGTITARPMYSHSSP